MLFRGSPGTWSATLLCVGAEWGGIGPTHTSAGKQPIFDILTMHYADLNEGSHPHACQIYAVFDLTARGSKHVSRDCFQLLRVSISGFRALNLAFARELIALLASSLSHFPPSRISKCYSFSSAFTLGTWNFTTQRFAHTFFTLFSMRDVNCSQQSFMFSELVEFQPLLSTPQAFHN
jgi:hypothetical protein